MKKFLKSLVEMLAASAYSEIGDSGYDWKDIEVNSAPTPIAGNILKRMWPPRPSSLIPHR